ncbi:hypothetical protein P0W64_11375 [Tsukamurella sp. 8F]|uniref:DUF7373 family lipoprotein n=1 Tax=unclassified Tsukamurella TaxID=2633480 RepID=UPI0023B9C9A2|nr:MULTISPECIES: hypothetical protein [unclassified Tsukamurella]MDF0528998.1 hypothetical protein [Tsukamurella sp. 8J]MDF0587371.1 hypothetical protein [Tsukamurella sp. 8F]
MKKTVLMLLVVGTAASLTACGTTVAGHAVESAGDSPGSVVPAGLDVGTYPTTMRAVPPSSRDRGWIVEGNRMGDALIQVSDVDPRLKIGGIALRSYPVLDGLNLSKRVPDETAAAFSTNKMRVGMTTTRGDKMDDPTVALRVGLYRFDTPDSATQALAAVEKGTGSQRRIVGIDGVFATEFKPGTVDSYRAEGPFVINISGTAPTTGEAAGLVSKAYAREVPEVRRFSPTPTASIQSLPGDDNGILARTLYEADPPISETEIANSYFDLYGLLLRIEDISDADMYRAAGIDAVGQGKTVVYRTRNEAAASGFLAARRSHSTPTAEPVPAPAGLATVRCAHYSDDGTFGCSGQVGRYVFTLSTDSLLDAQQAAAAQYTILAKNP